MKHFSLLILIRTKIDHTDNSEDHWESKSVTNETNLDCMEGWQQTAPPRVNTKLTSSTDRFSTDIVDKPRQSHFTSPGIVRSHTVGVSLNTVASESSNLCNSGDSNNLDRYTIQPSPDPHNYSIHQVTTSSNPASSESSRTFQQKPGDKNISWNLPVVTVASEAKSAARASRRTGQVNFIYIPQSAGRGCAASTHDKHDCTNTRHERVFYTEQSGYHRHSMSDLHLIDELNSGPESGPADGINQSRFELERSVNRNKLENINNFSNFDTRDISQNYESNSGYCKLTNRFATSSLLKPGLANSSLNSSREHLEYNSETAARARSPTEAITDSSVDLRQNTKYSSYQRPSPLKKRVSAPMIALTSRSGACVQRLGLEDCPGSSVIAGSQPVVTVFSGRYQHYLAGDLEMNTPIHGITSSVSMIIPTMAANLRPFPFPIQSHQSYEDVSKTQSQFSQNSSDNEYPAGGDGSSKDSIKRKSSRSKKSSIVSFVRGRRSNKGEKSETKHKRSYSMSRYHGGSSSKKTGMLHSQRSKEV